MNVNKMKRSTRHSARYCRAHDVYCTTLRRTVNWGNEWGNTWVARNRVQERERWIVRDDREGGGRRWWQYGGKEANVKSENPTRWAGNVCKYIAEYKIKSYVKIFHQILIFTLTNIRGIKYYYYNNYIVKT